MKAVKIVINVNYTDLYAHGLSRSLKIWVLNDVFNTDM